MMPEFCTYERNEFRNSFRWIMDYVFFSFCLYLPLCTSIPPLRRGKSCKKIPLFREQSVSSYCWEISINVRAYVPIKLTPFVHQINTFLFLFYTVYLFGFFYIVIFKQCFYFSHVSYSYLYFSQVIIFIFIFLNLFGKFL